MAFHWWADGGSTLYASWVCIIFSERKNGESFSPFVKHNTFTKMKYGPMYIFGVTLGNTTDSAHWDIIKIRGSMGIMYVNEKNFSCCLRYTKPSAKYYIRQPVIAFNIRFKREALSAPHFTCRNPNPEVVPDGVALTLNNYTCSEEHVTYRKPEVPLREPGEKLAICTKLAYGKRDAELIIEFMEVYKYLGVDKFVTYFLKDLNEDSKKVLEYYASTGIVDLYYFEQAEAGKAIKGQQLNIIISLLAASFHGLSIALANSLDPDQFEQNVRPDLDPNCLPL